MRICIFTRVEPAHREGKATFHQDILGPGLSKRGHEVTIITTARQDGIEIEERDGMSIFYLKGTPSDVYSEQFWKESAKKFDELHERKNFDIVCSESEGAFGWAAYSRYKESIPLIHIKHNTFSTIHKMTPLDIVLNRILPETIKLKLAGLRNFTIPLLQVGIKRIPAHYLTLFDKQYLFFKKVTEKLLIRADAIICVAKMLANSVMQDCPQSKEKIHIVYNGIDMTRFMPNEKKVQNLKRELGITDERVLLYIGRLSPEKGIDYLIRALPNIRGKYFKLVILGHGNQEYIKKLNALIKELNIKNKIIFIPGVPYSEVPAYYGIAEIVILPSLTPFEAFPFVIIEAFASKKPVIASQVGGVAEIVENNVNGYLVPPKNSAILAEKIGTLLEDDSLRDSFAKHGYSLVCEKFTLDHTLENTEKVFYQVIGT